MTINNKTVTLPVTLVNVIMGIITAAITTWGIVSVLRVRVERNENEIEKIQTNMVQKEEFNRLYIEIKDLNTKMDELIKAQ